MNKKRIAKEVALWALTVLLFNAFMRAGIMKFDDHSGWARAFRNWGFPVWFRVAIGAIEVVAAALVVWPRTAFYGAALMDVIMLGAVGTFLAHHSMHPTPIITFVWAALLAWGRYRTRLQFPRPRASGGEGQGEGALSTT